MSGPDIVIPVKPGDKNEELRYALRSIATHLPGREVWLAGHVPKWTSDAVGRIPVAQNSDKYRNALGNLLTACRHPEVSEQFVLWQDDVFLLRRPTAGIPVYHRGYLSDHVQRLRTARSRYYLKSSMNAVAALYDLGVGVPNMLCYEVHAPCPMLKTRVLYMDAKPEVQKFKGLYAVRSLYYNLWGPTGVLIEDFKVPRPDSPWDEEALYVSTNEKTFASHPAGDLLRELYPEPCRFERSSA